MFTNNAIGLAVELPATLVAIWLLDCAGRKKTTLALFLVLGGSVATSANFAPCCCSVLACLLDVHIVGVVMNACAMLQWCLLCAAMDH